MTDSVQTPPLGAVVPGWTPPPTPARRRIEGAWARLEPLDAAEHAAALFDAFAEDADGAMWRYLAYGPFGDRHVFDAWLAEHAAGPEPQFFAVIPRDAAAAGLISYLRPEPAHGSIEIGHLSFSPRLQRTPAATDAVFHLIDHAFALGYRRVEWKCDALNAASRRAARRYGFVFEGVFRQMMVVKGRNRDTAWHAILDRDWPRLAPAYRAWLDASNFDARAVQRRALSDLTRAAGAES